MIRHVSVPRWSRLYVALAAVVAAVGMAFTGVARESGTANIIQGPGEETRTQIEVSRQQQIERGRQLVIEDACSFCHGGVVTPDQEGWLVGATKPELEFLIGPCALQAGAQPCFRTRPRNLTPDNLTGIGRFTERQIFNALRFGLRPEETADVEITSTTPGQGNFPLNPRYLAPPMPWPGWRNMPDDELWAIAAYLKNGVKPVSSRIADSDGPPDFWAGAYPVEFIGTWPAPPFPTANEVMPARAADLEKIRRGRQLVLQHECGGCHGGMSNPAGKGFLVGVTRPDDLLPVGACAVEPGTTPCYLMRPRNLTPDNATGTGRYSERQIFNALRYGLRPSTTPDVDITSGTPGMGKFPAKPDYLGPDMPWPSFRHMPDSDLRAIAAYLKRGLRPVSNKVEDSDKPPEGWASAYSVENIGSFPAPAFPTNREVKR